MENKYTPGPWRVDESEEWTINVIAPWSNKVTTDNISTYGDYRGAHVCEMHWNTGVPKRSTAMANAKLIAAAPDLLEACQKLMKANAIMAKYIIDNDTEFTVDTGMQAYTLASNAIKKATE